MSGQQGWSTNRCRNQWLLSEIDVERNSAVESDENGELDEERHTACHRIELGLLVDFLRGFGSLLPVILVEFVDSLELGGNFLHFLSVDGSATAEWEHDAPHENREHDDCNAVVSCHGIKSMQEKG